MEKIKEALESIKKASSQANNIKTKYDKILKEQKKQYKILTTKTNNSLQLVDNISMNKYFNERLVMVSIMFQNEEMHDEQGYIDFYTKAYNIFSFLNANGITFLLTTKMIDRLLRTKQSLDTEEEVLQFVYDYEHDKL